MRNFCFVCFLLLPLSLTAEDELWTRPVVVGASLSDGFHYSEMYDFFLTPRSDGLSLDRYLDRAIVVPHGKIRNFGSAAIFLAVDAAGKNQVKRARALKPTVLFATDFLFWFLYGDPKRRGEGFAELTRLEFLEKGLSHLEQFDCPIVIGDIPDGQRAVGRMILKKQYPGREVIDQANVRIREWVKAHPNVSLVPLSDFFEKASANLEVTIGKKTIPAGKSRRKFIERDMLHPTEFGAAAMTVLILKQLQASRNFSDQDIQWDTSKLLPTR